MPLAGAAVVVEMWLGDRRKPSHRSEAELIREAIGRFLADQPALSEGRWGAGDTGDCEPMTAERFDTGDANAFYLAGEGALLPRVRCLSLVFSGQAWRCCGRGGGVKAPARRRP